MSGEEALSVPLPPDRFGVHGVVCNYSVFNAHPNSERLPSDGVSWRWGGASTDEILFFRSCLRKLGAGRREVALRYVPGCLESLPQRLESSQRLQQTCYDGRGFAFRCLHPSTSAGPVCV